MDLTETIAPKSDRVEIPLTQGYVAIVDSEDAEAVLAFRWHARPCARGVYAGRNTRRPDGRRAPQLLHTFLTGWSYVDHRNGDGLDNRRANLRETTRAENMRNRRRNLNSTSGYKGVGWHKVAQKWWASIQADGRRRHIGLYPTAEEAALAYDAAARDLHGEYATLNFPAPGERAA